jgi:uncharacterized membrane protein
MIRFKGQKTEFYWWRIFEFGVLLKAINGVWETIAGISILILGRNGLIHLFEFLARGELVEHPPDFLIRAGTRVIQGHVPATFVGLYFLLHGATNIFLSIQLYRNKLWAYLVTIGVMAVFIIYQLYRIRLYHSPLLQAVTVYDILFIMLTWHEYNYQKNIRASQTHAQT